MKFGHACNGRLHAPHSRSLLFRFRAKRFSLWRQAGAFLSQHGRPLRAPHSNTHRPRTVPAPPLKSSPNSLPPWPGTSRCRVVVSDLTAITGGAHQLWSTLPDDAALRTVRLAYPRTGQSRACSNWIRWRGKHLPSLMLGSFVMCSHSAADNRFWRSCALSWYVHQTGFGGIRIDVYFSWALIELSPPSLAAAVCTAELLHFSAGTLPVGGTIIPACESNPDRLPAWGNVPWSCVSHSHWLRHMSYSIRLFFLSRGILRGN